jgi:alkylation response protein AidB-like acyl-CoA dehydrogenase
MKMDFQWAPEHAALRTRARQIAQDAVKRYGRFNDTWMNGYSKEFSAELGALGWIGMTWPTEFGGGGRPAIERLIIAEEMIAAGAPIAASWFADRQMSEPNAGSDLASLKTFAQDDGDEWVINGQKIWTSFGEVADYCYLICRTSTDGPPHAGISEIIVPMNTPGIDIRPIKDMTTNSHFCEVFYTDARVPKANLVGVQGGAFSQTMRQLEHERGGIDRLVSNKALYDMALKRADTTNKVVRQEIANIEIGYRIGRILVIRETLRQAPAGFSAATKCFCTELETRISNFVFSTLGMDATLWDDVTQGLAYASGYTIMGGTSNVMRNILGERVLGLPKEPPAQKAQPAHN